MAQRFETRLRECGCHMDITVFRDLTVNTLAQLYPGWNDEDLMHRPQEALRYCQHIRQAAACYDLPDELILRVLSATRKASQ